MPVGRRFLFCFRPRDARLRLKKHRAPQLCEATSSPEKCGSERAICRSRAGTSPPDWGYLVRTWHGGFRPCLLQHTRRNPQRRLHRALVNIHQSTGGLCTQLPGMRVDIRGAYMNTQAHRCLSTRHRLGASEYPAAFSAGAWSASTNLHFSRAHAEGAILGGSVFRVRLWFTTSQKSCPQLGSWQVVSASWPSTPHRARRFQSWPYVCAAQSGHSVIV